MIRFACFAAAALIGVTAAEAQTPPSGLPQTTLSVSIKSGYDSIKLNLIEAAEKMPPTEFGFKVGTMPETRTYAQLFGHVANSQFGTCAAVRGVPNPNMGKNLEQTATTKDAAVAAIKESFAFCDDAFATLTEQNLLQMIKQGKGETARAAALANLVRHSNEMYGTVAAYMRTKGLVPPSTERSQQGK
jgi:hypothetical protein